MFDLDGALLHHALRLARGQGRHLPHHDAVGAILRADLLVAIGLGRLSPRLAEGDDRLAARQVPQGGITPRVLLKDHAHELPDDMNHDGTDQRSLRPAPLAGTLLTAVAVTHPARDRAPGL